VQQRDRDQIGICHPIWSAFLACDHGPALTATNREFAPAPLERLYLGEIFWVAEGARVDRVNVRYTASPFAMTAVAGI
jgi:hypothetical protein